MLKVRGLSLTSRDGRLLDDISLTATAKKISFVIGNNGSGKSTLLSTLANIDLPYEGEIVINHFNARLEPDRTKLMIGYASEVPDLPEQLTAIEYLELVGSIYRMENNEIKAVITGLSEILRLKTKLYSLTGSLSISEQKRLSLVAAFMAEPAVLLLDEPLLFLDYPTAKILKTLIIERSETATIIISTNDLSFAEEMAEQLFVLDNGQLIADGTVSQLSAQLQIKKDLALIYTKLIGD